MSLDLSLSSLSPIVPSDVSGAAHGPADKARVEKVARAVEGLFVGQLMAELGKGMTGTADSKDASFYQDFIQQAMTQQVVSGGGFGLAHLIESYVNQSSGAKPDHPPVALPVEQKGSK